MLYIVYTVYTSDRSYLVIWRLMTSLNIIYNYYYSNSNGSVRFVLMSVGILILTDTTVKAVLTTPAPIVA